jgi:hypothetical protein
MPKLVGLNLTETQFSKLKCSDLPSECRYNEVKLHPPKNVVDLTKFPLVDTTQFKQKPSVRGFYEKQNALIHLFREHAMSLNNRGNDLESKDSFTNTSSFSGSGDEEDSNTMIQSAIVMSFVANILLLVMKLWLAILTGSMAIIASAADSLLGKTCWRICLDFFLFFLVFILI